MYKTLGLVWIFKHLQMPSPLAFSCKSQEPMALPKSQPPLALPCCRPVCNTATNLGLRVHQVATTTGASKATSVKGEALLGMALPWPRGSSLLKAPSALAPCMASYVQKSTPWEIPPKQPQFGKFFLKEPETGKCAGQCGRPLQVSQYGKVNFTRWIQQFKN